MRIQGTVIQAFRPTALRMRGTDTEDDSPINYSKIDPFLISAIEQGNVPISLFVKTREPLTLQQREELQGLGLHIRQAGRTMSTAHLQELEHLGKITDKDYIKYLAASHQLHLKN